jgi:hypothetical protein
VIGIPSNPKSLREDLSILRDQFARGEQMVAIHYACENIYDAGDHPPKVACIAYCPIGRGSAGSFGHLGAPRGEEGDDGDAAEKWVLRQYFEMIKQNPTVTIVHWNMNKADYGFTALESRYRYLFGEEAPYRVPQDRAFDLDDLVAAEHGEFFVRHPRLSNLAQANHLTRQHALLGRDEADRFAAGDHGAVHRSVEEKVRWIAVMAELFLSGSLTTDRSVGSFEFANGRLDAIQTVVTLAQRSLYVHRELSRRHGERTSLVDEYDNQDFLRGLLRMFFDDIRSENYVPEYAGSNSRIDFFLPDVKLAIELKHTRESLNSAKLGEELIVDRARYAERSDVRHLICLVFDYEGRLENPRGLEADISREMTDECTGVTVVIIDR